NPIEAMIAHARDEVTPPSQVQRDVPADLERVILRCLAKNPEGRLQDTDHLEQALAECAAADRWTQSQAARWWRIGQAGPRAIGRQPRPPGLTPRTLLTGAVLG